MLIAKNHIFVPFDDTTNIVILANKMPNHIMHNLRPTSIIHHKKMLKER
jgi:hypothetical protein